MFENSWKQLNLTFARRLFVILMTFAGGVYSTSDAKAADEKTVGAYARHDYTAKIRASVWLTFVDGEFETDRPVGGGRIGVQFNRDLRYDDPYPTPIVEGAFRRGRHDFWVTGMIFDEEETAPIRASFEIDGEVFDIGSDVITAAEITDVNFQYGYSFYTFEEDGFRFGPTLAVSYTRFDFELTEVTLGGVGVPATFEYDEEFPIPTIGAHLEIPYNDFVFAAQLGAFYFEASDFEGTGARAEASVTWRPFDHVGFYAGIYGIYADLEFSGDDIEDLLLLGPSIGLEVRF